MSPAEVFLAHLLAAHLAVPEPVRLRLEAGPVGFEGWTAKHEAVMQREGDGWVIRYDRRAFAASRPERVRFVLAHEACHGAYDWNVYWDRLTPADQAERQERADRCARKILRDHKDCR